METDRHAILKRLAAVFLRGQGCRAVATEVRVPASRYRADVAAYLDRLPIRPRRRAAAPTPPGGSGPIVRESRPKTVIIECKQSRADFLRDTADTKRLLLQRERLEAQRVELEENRIKPHEPELRRAGTYLFGELEEWDFTASRLVTYRRVLAELRAVDAQLYGQTKFWLMARYRVADLLFLLAPAGMVRRRELPVGGGLLECPRAWLQRAERRPAAAWQEPVPLHVAMPSVELPSKPEFQSRLLGNIAAAATRAWLAATAPEAPPPPAEDPAPRAKSGRRGIPQGLVMRPDPTEWLF